MAGQRSEAYPAVLTIAGSDSSGGAGIQADLKTFTALGCYGSSVITALTAQNTTGVQAVHAPPPAFVEEQLKSVLEDVHIVAMKTGMLFDAAITRAVAQGLRAYYVNGTLPPLVCDPVCVSTSGHTLLQENAVEVMINEIFPLSALVTPNKSEAELLLSRRGMPCTIHSIEDMLVASSKLLSLGPKAVLLKGGHITATLAELDQVSAKYPDLRVVRAGLLGENMEILLTIEQGLAERSLVVDVLQQPDASPVVFVRPRVDSSSTHGTGCTLSAALACALAAGHNLVDATETATAYTHSGIENACGIGKGNGPLNHQHGIILRSIPQPTPTCPHPLTRALIVSTKDIWKAYVQHDFVKELARGTLRRECFLHFIKQDYHYLRYYARAYGLLAAKLSTFDAIGNATRTINNVLSEIKMHRSFCAKWDITEADLDATPESPATTAYGAYIIDAGLQGDTSKLIMALAACLLGYGEVGLWLEKEAEKPGSWVVLEGNPYLKWIEDYSGPDYQRAVRLGIETIEAIAVADPPSPKRFEEWRKTWEACTRLEKGFWDMAMGLL